MTNIYLIKESEYNQVQGRLLRSSIHSAYYEKAFAEEELEKLKKDSHYELQYNLSEQRLTEKPDRKEELFETLCKAYKQINNWQKQLTPPSEKISIQSRRPDDKL